MTDIVFFSRVIPLDIKEWICSKRKGTMSESGESLQWKIIEGITENIKENITLFNYMPIQSWPGSYKDAYVPGGEHLHFDGTKIINLPFLNITVLKRLFMGKALYREIKKWAKRPSLNRKTVLSYSLTPEFLRGIRIAKKIDKNIKAVAIVADLPEYTILESKISLSTKIYLNWMKRATKVRLGSIDGFVLLTDQMSEKLVSNNQKYIVMEGIASLDALPKEYCEDKYVLYAGTLHEKFGILKLLDAFSYVKTPNLKLVICGLGDSVDKVIAKQSIDNRIDYRGQLTRIEVLQLMSRASIIVNPRFEKDEFTKYSFPSKNLEALSSGVPFIAYKLPGIPDEYDQFINYPIDDSSEAFATMIDCIINDYNYYLDKATNGRIWVFKEKNKAAQTKKVVDFIGAICDEQD